MIDPRGPRFAATVTSVVLAAALLTGSGPLVLAQALVFTLGAVNLRYAPYAALYRHLIAPRLALPAEREPAAPVRFAQGVGLVFALLSAAGYLLGRTWLGVGGAGLALAAAFLNAAFGYCLGCDTYLLLRRLRLAAEAGRNRP